MLAASEIVSNGYQSGYYAYAITSEGSQYQYYKLQNPTWNVENSSLVKNISENGSAIWWWLRSAYCNTTVDFCGVDKNGNASNGGYAGRTAGVAPGFCI